MNKIPLNIAGLDGGVIIKKGGGGGATINNQEKSVDITENGVTEVTADAGFTGLSKVVVNTNVASSGGGAPVSKPVNDVNFYDYDGTILHSYTKEEFLALSAMPPLPEREGLICQEWNWTYEEAQEYVAEYGLCDIGATYITDDGATRVYVRVADEFDKGVTLALMQGSINDVAIDWGDGSPIETQGNSTSINVSHNYSKVGDYKISLHVADGGSLVLGRVSSSYNIAGSSNSVNVYLGRIYKVEIGERVIGVSYAFQKLSSLESITIPKMSPTAASRMCEYCYGLRALVLPHGWTAVDTRMCYGCESLKVISCVSGINLIGENSLSETCIMRAVFPDTVTMVGDFAFIGTAALQSIRFPKYISTLGHHLFNSSAVEYLDFSRFSVIPSLSGLGGTMKVKQIIVPDALYDEWIAATNWSTYASKIIKKSDWDASQS